MGYDPIVDVKLDDVTENELKAKGVVSLATRPNAPSRYGEGGLTAEALKAKFDGLARALADRINTIHKYLRADDLDARIKITALLDDEGNITLSKFGKYLLDGNAAAKYIKVYDAQGLNSLQQVITDILARASTDAENNEKNFRDLNVRADGLVQNIVIDTVVSLENITVRLTRYSDKGVVLGSEEFDIPNAPYLIYEHNKSEEAHQDIRGLIQSNGMQIDSMREDIAEVRGVAEGRVRARAYRTWDDALLAISSLDTLEEARKEFAIGDQIYIRTPKSTDAWVSGFETRHEPYPGGLGDDLDPFDKWESTEIHVGYLIISPLEAPDIDLTGYVTTDDLNEYSEKVDSAVAETKEYVDKVVNSFDPPSADKVERLAAEVANLTARIAPEYFTTDSSAAYVKEVPAAALPFAEVQEVGGMSYAEGGEIKNAAVTALETVGYNILDLTPALNECLVYNGDGTYTLRKVNGERFSEFFPIYIPKGQEVFCYIEIVNTSIDGLTRIPLQLFGADKIDNRSSIGLSNGGQAFAPQAETFFAKAYLQHSDAEGAYVTFRSPMIKYGKSAEFSPYAKHTYPIPAEVQALEGWGLGVNETYHNRLLWAEKKYRQEVARYVFTGDNLTNWEDSNRSFVGLYLDNVIPYLSDIGNDIRAVCNDFTVYARVPLEGERGIGLRQTGTINRLYIRDDSFSSAADFKAYFAEKYASGNPVTIDYVLASPIVTDLPDLPDDNFIEVEGGGTVTAVNEHELAAPTKIEYQLKEATA